MRFALTLILALTSSLGLASRADAQTTGVPCINDYTIVDPAGLGGVSGSTSCTPLAFPGGGPVTLSISGSSTAVLCLVLVKGTPCSPGTLCLPPSFCPIPFSACGGTTNLSYDLTLPVPTPAFVCPMVPVPGAPCTTCIIPVPLPPSITFSTQAVILDFTCGPPSFFHVLPTQAYDVAT